MYHVAVGAAALVGTVMVCQSLVLSVVLSPFGAFIISRPLNMAITIEIYPVRFEGVFSENSLQRSSITAVEIEYTGKGTILTSLSSE